jgi:hypothetical protein
MYVKTIYPKMDYIFFIYSEHDSNSLMRSLHELWSEVMSFGTYHNASRDRLPAF